MGGREKLRWANFNAVGRISEVTVLAPIKRGRIPGERRTYEQRLRDHIDTIQTRADNRVPTALSKVQSIHFGRLIVIRPEQYLSSSSVCGVDYAGHMQASEADSKSPADPHPYPNKFPVPIDPFQETFRFLPGKGCEGGKPVETNESLNNIELNSAPACSDPKDCCANTNHYFPSMLLVLVEFDGDPAVYFRDIAEKVAGDFDRVLDNCVNFPGTMNFEAFWRWIRRYQLNADLFLPIYPDLTTVRIKALQRFRARFDAFAARVRSSRAAGAANIDELFDDFLRETEQAGEGFPYDSGLFVEPDKGSD